MDYPCGKFGDCSFGCFGSIVRTDRHRETQRLVGVSNKRLHAVTDLGRNLGGPLLRQKGFKSQ